MKLALKTTAGSSATRWQRLQSALIGWRMCSAYCHGAIVIGDLLLHATPQGGLHATMDWDPAKWVLIDVGGERDAQALALFDARIGAPYNWLGVLGFVLPWVPGSKNSLYCFAWCALALGVPSARWITPERLLAHIVVTHGKD
jgi:hypothetical protein